MKILVKILIILFLTPTICTAKDFRNYTVEKYSPKWACCLQDYISDHLQYRATIYNALNLTDNQREIFKNSVANEYIYYKQKSQEIVDACNQLQILKNNHLPTKTQKKYIRNILNEMKKNASIQNKDLKKSLTRYQRSKYRLITHLEHNDGKKDCRMKDYYKSNPQMLPFGAWSQKP